MRKFILIIAVLLVSCSQTLDKSVFEPLNVNELGKEIENDTMFKYVYDYIREVESKMTETEKAGFYDVTYKDALTFTKQVSGGSYQKLENEFTKQWNNRYAYIDKKIDSLISVIETVEDANLKMQLKLYNRSDDEDMKSVYKTFVIEALNEDNYISIYDFVFSKIDSVYKDNKAYNLLNFN